MVTSDRHEGKAARNAYQKALSAYKDSLPPKEYAKITVPTKLEDLLETTQRIEEKHKTSRTIKLLANLYKGKVRLERFNKILEGGLKIMLGGELIWASINYVFTVVSESAETFAKLLDVFVTISEKMPQFEILSNTFEESPTVIDAVEALYTAIIKFWVAAVKYYRKRRLWLMPLYNNYSVLYHDLVSELNKQERRLRDTALVQHMFEAKEERIENKLRRRGTTFNTGLNVNRIVKWLSPSDIYEPDFFEADFEKANRKRHPGTCEWIKKKQLFRDWEKIDKGVLVIYGIPGAGKTILSSYLIQRLVHDIEPGSPKLGLYFYFDNKDEHKRSPAAAVRSLVYQLYSHLREQGRAKLMIQELELRMQNSANERSNNYDRLWAVFKAVIISDKLDVTVVLDAMDECNGPKTFIRDLKKLAASAKFRVIVTSRSDNHVVPVFAAGENTPALYITTEDVKKDIVSYIEAQVAKYGNLHCHPEVKDRVITALSTKSGGMFLWVYLMLKVLKGLGRVSDVIHALDTLPERLDDVYKRILVHLEESLKPGPKQFCQTVLRWIVSTSRPLLFNELVEALKAECRQSTSLFEEEHGFQDSLLYGKKDIELVCGSLVTVSGDSIRLIHLSTRDYLRSNPEAVAMQGPATRFLIDVPITQNRIALTCIDYLSSQQLRQGKNFYPKTQTRNSDLHSARSISVIRQSEIQGLKDANAFLEYAVLYWVDYLISTSKLSSQESMSRVEKFLVHEASITWLEVYLSIVGPEYAASRARQMAGMEGMSNLVYSWAGRLVALLDDYSITMTSVPQMIHSCFHPQGMEKVESHTKIQTLIQIQNSEQDLAYGINQAKIKDTNQKLPDNQSSSLSDIEKGAKSWIYFDPNLKLMYSTLINGTSMRLACQNALDGTRYRPTIDAEEESPSSEWAVRSVAVRPSGSHVAICFCPAGINGISGESFYRTVLWLIKDPSKQLGSDDWAERVLVDKTQTSLTRCPVQDSYRSEGRGSLLSFGNDATLICPGGIYNIFTEERLATSEDIFDSDPGVANTTFSKDRVARIRDLTRLEILTLNGFLVRTVDFPGSEVLQICAFGQSGRKIIMTYCDVTAGMDLRRIFCVHVDTGKRVRLQSRGVSRINYPQFTADEKSVVGRLGCLPDHHGSEIAIWCAKDGSVKYLYKNLDNQLSFCLNEREQSVIIVSSTGKMIVRGLHQEWNEREDREMMSSRAALATNGKTVTKIIQGRDFSNVTCTNISSESPELYQDTWDLQSISPRLKKSVHMKLEATSQSGLSVSPNCDVIAVKGQLIRSSDSNLQPMTDDCLNAITADQYFFSPTGQIIIGVEESTSNRILHIFKLDEKLNATAIKPAYIDGFIMDLTIAFHDKASMFALSYTAMDAMTGSMIMCTCIADVAGNEAEFQHLSGSFHQDLGFSQCGEYIYGNVSCDMDDPGGNDLEEPEESDYERYSSGSEHDLGQEAHDLHNNSRPPSAWDLPTRSFADDPHEEQHVEILRPDENVSQVNCQNNFYGDVDYYDTVCSNYSGDSDSGSNSKPPHYDHAAWPKLFPLSQISSNLRQQNGSASSATTAVTLALGSFYVYVPHICRLRMDDNSGILFLDKRRIHSLSKTSITGFKSRILCVVPDVYRRMAREEMQGVLLVWPRGEGGMEAGDGEVKVLLAPSGVGTGPVMIKTGLAGLGLLDF
ncbi:MAG: hypothetical protein Q9167_005591 [Letrouitia subvulpina]